MRRRLAVVLVAAGALTLLSTGVAHAWQNEPKTTITAKALIDHECNDTEWHFVINQIASEGDAPPSIHVTWANGHSEDVSLTKFTGGVGHYVTTDNLDSTVTSATASIYIDWSGQFNLSHGPCGNEETTTTTVKPTTTTTEGVTSTTTLPEVTTTTLPEVTTTTLPATTSTTVTTVTSATTVPESTSTSTVPATTPHTVPTTSPPTTVMIGTPASVRSLPFTGSATWPLTLTGIGLILGGLILGSRKRSV